MGVAPYIYNDVNTGNSKVWIAEGNYSFTSQNMGWLQLSPCKLWMLH